MALARLLSTGTEVLGPAPRNRLLIDPGVQLQINVPLQKQDNWCWAAVAVGVANAYQDPDPEWTFQCNVARRVKNRTCCPAGDFRVCDEPDDLGPALKDHHDPTPIPPQNGREFSFVKDQINDGVPLAVRVAFPNAEAGHFVVISGYSEDGGIPHLWIFDPATGLEAPHQFDTFKLGYQDLGTWDQTFRTKGTPTSAQKVLFR